MKLPHNIKQRVTVWPRNNKFICSIKLKTHDHIKNSHKNIHDIQSISNPFPYQLVNRLTRSIIAKEYLPNNNNGSIYAITQAPGEYAKINAAITEATAAIT